MHESYGWDGFEDDLDRQEHRRRRKTAVVLAVFALLAAAALAVLAVVTDGFQSFDGAVRLPEIAAKEAEAATSHTYPMDRAEFGDVTLTLQSREGAATLTYQEIYADANCSVVTLESIFSPGSYSVATGVVLTEDGYIITNEHVVDGAAAVNVLTWDDKIYKAKLVGADAATDLAVLKVDAAGLTPAVFGQSDELTVGDEALAIGNPLGEKLRSTLTNGIISAINRNVTLNDYQMTLIQTTAAVNKGNSGGPLLNLYGQVVGIVNMKMTSSSSVAVEGLGFAIPSATVKEIAEELIRQGEITSRVAIGITGYDLQAERDGVTGVFVYTVHPNSDAYTAGLRAGDIILTCNGQTVTGVQQLNELKEGMSLGDVLHLTVLRGTEELSFDVKLVDKANVET